MALYTLSLSEYLERGGKLPPCFEDIPTYTSKEYINGEVVIVGEYPFEKMFIDRYFEREIGYETPALFYQRLNALAVLKVPEYSRKIELIRGLDDVLDIEKTETIEQSAKTENFVGSFNNLLGVATPANKNAEVTGTSSDTHTFKGATESERVFTVKQLIALDNIYEKLLDEFNKLFMGIY